jgi:hypothetical protein
VIKIDRLLKIITGELFGGFTSIGWDSSNTTAVDNTAFLFKLGLIPEM